MMHRRSLPAWLLFAVGLSVPATAFTEDGFRVTTLQDLDGPGWKLADPGVQAEIERIREAAPSEAPARPARPRTLLIYGRRTHPPVPRCFVSFEAMGRKSGAFTTVWSGDPAVFLPENLRQFDAVLMNNTHESSPMLPPDYRSLDERQRKLAEERAAVCEKSLLDFVRGGKGLAGIHGATFGIRWTEYNDMIGGQCNGGMIIDKGLWLRVAEPDHPLVKGLSPLVEVSDEVYGFDGPNKQPPVGFSRDRVRVLLELERERAPREKLRDDVDHAVSWIKPHGKGRVFYCSVGHQPGTYVNPYILRHWLAGIQFVIGDLDAPAETRAGAARAGALERLRSAEEAVRLEAIRALGRVGTAADVPSLVALATAPDASPEKQAAAAALGSMPGDEVDAAILGPLASADARTGPALTAVVVRRVVSGVAGRAVTSAAIGLMAKASPGAERASVARAVMEGCRRHPEPRHHQAVLALLSGGDAEMRRLLLPIVGEQGTSEALATIHAALRDSDETVKDAAVRGLCNWPTADVAAEILAVAKAPTKPEHRSWAVQAIARVLENGLAGPSPQAVAVLGESLLAAERPADKQAVLTRLATARSPQALAVAVSATADETIRPQAVVAVVSIAQAIWKTDQQAARAALEKIEPFVTDPVLRKRIDGIRGVPQAPLKPKAA